MFGRMRPCPVDCLELERPPSKIIKHDTLSIYEATLEKLRLGSRHALTSSSGKAMEIDAHSSGSASSSSSDASRSIDRSKQQMEKNLFSSFTVSKR